MSLECLSTPIKTCALGPLVDWPVVTMKVSHFVKQNWPYITIWCMICVGSCYFSYKVKKPVDRVQQTPHQIIGLSDPKVIENSVLFLNGDQNYSRYQKIGLYAPEGFGKTTVAEEIAHQAHAQLISLDLQQDNDPSQILTQVKDAQPAVLLIKNYKVDQAVEDIIGRLNGKDRIVVIFAADDVSDPSCNRVNQKITIAPMNRASRFAYMLRYRNQFVPEFKFSHWAQKLAFCQGCGCLNKFIEFALQIANGSKLADDHFEIAYKYLSSHINLTNDNDKNNNSKDNIYDFTRNVDTKFADVGGNKQAKKALKRNLLFMGEGKERAERLGLKSSHIVMHGEPGTGKTLLARALAGECDCAFISTSAANFVTQWQGSGAANVKALFEVAKSAGKDCIIFIDEIDSLGSRKNLSGQHATQISAINELLAQIDGFEKPKHNITLIAATNNLKNLDEALLRDGRLTPIKIEIPSNAARKQILKVRAKRRAFAEDVGWNAIVNQTKGWTGAQLEGLINDAAILAFDTGCSEIAQQHLIDAINKRKQASNSAIGLSYII